MSQREKDQIKPTEQSLDMKDVSDTFNIKEELSDSEDSTVSFHSLNEQLENLNVEETDFKMPNFNSYKEEQSTDDHYQNASDDVESAFLDEENNAKNDENTKAELIDDYFIDEDYLKNIENNLSEEEKMKLQEKAKDLKSQANHFFKDHLYKEAAQFYTEALNVCPLLFSKDRSILFANRAAARSKKETTKDDDIKGAIEDCDAAIALSPSYEKAVHRRATLHRQSDHLNEALEDYKTLLTLAPGNLEARHAVQVLPREIEEKNEKLKTEMMGKLKDLGNMVLKPFGLSTDNFQVNQNSESGGYSVNFKQN